MQPLSQPAVSQNPPLQGIPPTPSRHGRRVQSFSGGIVQLASQIHTEVLATVAGTELPGVMDSTDVMEMVRSADPLLPSDDACTVAQVVLANTQGLGCLDPFFADDQVSEVMVNGGGDVWVERDGRLQPVGLVVTPAEVLAIVERVLAPLGLKVDRRHPVVDARLPDGSRLHVVVPPVAVDGPCVTIRRFRIRPVPLSSFAPVEVAKLLGTLVEHRCNIVVSGGTGAGKTTLLNAMAARIGGSDRIVTIEDTAELRLPGDHVVRLEARPAGSDDAFGTDIAELVRSALRMRPDRIIVGEVRGVEARAMLMAMNTGHEGSLSTVHANSPPDALRRLEVMAMGTAPQLPLTAVRSHVAAAIDAVVQVARTGTGTREVVAIDEVVGSAESGGPITTRKLVHDGAVVARPTRWRKVSASPTLPIEVVAK